MSRKYKTGMVSLAMENGREEHQARIIGDLAVLGDADCWQVVHVSTGQYLKRGLCCYRSAKGLAEALLVLRWDFASKALWVKEDRETAREICNFWTCPAKKQMSA